MQIQTQFKEDEGLFFMEENGEKLAKMHLRKRGNDRIIIEHTEVSEKLKGQGAGKRLVDHAVNYARQNHLKIVPLCPFAKSVFEKIDAYKDVL